VIAGQLGRGAHPERGQTRVQDGRARSAPGSGQATSMVRPRGSPPLPARARFPVALPRRRRAMRSAQLRWATSNVPASWSGSSLRSRSRRSHPTALGFASWWIRSAISRSASASSPEGTPRTPISAPGALPPSCVAAAPGIGFHRAARASRTDGLAEVSYTDKHTAAFDRLRARIEEDRWHSSPAGPPRHRSRWRPAR
jgi:hypothetical protein